MSQSAQHFRKALQELREEIAERYLRLIQDDHECLRVLLWEVARLKAATPPRPVPEGNDKPRYWPEGALFIKAELDTGLAFAAIALQSTSLAKTVRNTASARLAYDTARRFEKKVLFAHADAMETAEKFGTLKGELIRLGERF